MDVDIFKQRFIKLSESIFNSLNTSPLSKLKPPKFLSVS